MQSRPDIRDTAATPGSPAPGTPGFVERRRPGRIENVSPQLIPLLRGEGVAPTPLESIEPKIARSERLLWAAMCVFLAFVAFLAAGGLHRVLSTPNRDESRVEAVTPEAHAAKSPPDLRHP